MSALFYISFCDTTRPKGTQFLGATVVALMMPRTPLSKPRFLAPTQEAKRLSWNCMEQLKTSCSEAGRKYLNKLVSREVVMGEIGDADVDPDAFVCQTHNPVSA